MTTRAHCPLHPKRKHKPRPSLKISIHKVALQTQNWSWTNSSPSSPVCTQDKGIPESKLDPIPLSRILRHPTRSSFNTKTTSISLIVRLATISTNMKRRTQSREFQTNSKLKLILFRGSARNLAQVFLGRFQCLSLSSMQSSLPLSTRACLAFSISISNQILLRRSIFLKDRCSSQLLGSPRRSRQALRTASDR
jgi:hypothetical protein